MTARWQWSSSARFIVVCAAAVVGLSSFWRLPLLTLAYGGGAFLLVYLLAVVALGLPLLSGQLLLARGTQADIAGVFARWTRESPHSRIWVWLGALAVVGSMLLLACYSVIASWSMAYTLRGAAGLLGDVNLAQSKVKFYAFAQDAEGSFGWQLVFLGLTVAAAAQGLRRGIEPIMRTLAVLLLLLFVVLLVAVSMQPDVMIILRMLFAFDFAELGWRGVLEALYQAFYTLSLGTGVIVILGSYLPRQTPVVRVAAAVLVLDVLASLAAVVVLGVMLDGLGTLPNNGLEGLFVILPAAWNVQWQITLVYALVSLVALAAAIGLFEPLVRMVQYRLQLTRLRASLYAGVMVWLIGLAGLLSFSGPDQVQWLGMNLFNVILLVATNVILPLIGLALCLFLGRVLLPQRLQRVWGTGSGQGGYAGFRLWHDMLRYPTRVVLALVLFYSLGGVALVQWLWGAQS